MGIKLMVSVWPTVDPKSPNYPEMLEKGYLIHTDRGNRTHWSAAAMRCSTMPPTPAPGSLSGTKIKKHYYDRGIKHFWLDAAEPETIPYHFDNFRYHMGSALRWPTSIPITMKNRI